MTIEKERTARSYRPSAATIALGVILLVSAVRVASTWAVFSQTYDEGTHIAAGLEWLTFGRYDSEPQHPPLARIAAAIGPYLAGARIRATLPLPAQGNEILHSGSYTKMLSLARAGILPFFLLSVVVVWFYARQLGGNVAAVAAALLYANLPPVLAHAGLATTDMAVTAGLISAVALLHLWLLKPSRTLAVLLGLALAAAFTSKFSAPLFFAAAAVATIVAVADSGLATKVPSKRLVPHLLIVAAVCSLSVWSVYRFHFEPLHGHHLFLVQGWLDGSALHRAIEPQLRAVPIPAPEIVSGIAEMLIHNREAHNSYLFGEHKVGSWWYYFPIAVAVKTTLGFLAIALISAFILVRRALGDRTWWSIAAPIFAALAVLVVCLPMSINIGIRHVLPIYPLLAVAAGCGVAILWRRSWPHRAAVVALVVLELVVSARAHPDYLPYFNLLAGPRPEGVLLDSNLDWGQDLLRLSRRCRELGIRELRFSYFGTADLAKHDLPALLAVPYEKPLPGWFAVSEGNIGSPTYPVTFPWLDRYEPVERVGKSIRLYYIPREVVAREDLGAMEQLVVPLPLGRTAGADGRVWTAELELESRGPVPLTLQDGRGHALRVMPGRRAKWELPGATLSRLLYVHPEEEGWVTANVRVSSHSSGEAAGSPLLVPVPHSSAFSSRPLRFSLPQSCAGCRRMIRLYDLGPAGAVSVKVTGTAYSSSRDLELARQLSETEEAASLAFELGNAFTGVPNEPVEITVTPRDGASRLWGFATLSEGEGERLVLPARR